MRALWVVAALVALGVHSSQGFMPFFGSYREASQNYYGMYTSFTVSKMISVACLYSFITVVLTSQMQFSNHHFHRVYACLF